MVDAQGALEPDKTPEPAAERARRAAEIARTAREKKDAAFKTAIARFETMRTEQSEQGGTHKSPERIHKSIASGGFRGFFNSQPAADAMDALIKNVDLLKDKSEITPDDAKDMVSNYNAILAAVNTRKRRLEDVTSKLNEGQQYTLIATKEIPLAITEQMENLGSAVPAIRKALDDDKDKTYESETASEKYQSYKIYKKKEDAKRTQEEIKTGKQFTPEEAVVAWNKVVTEMLGRIDKESGKLVVVESEERRLLRNLKDNFDKQEKFNEEKKSNKETGKKTEGPSPLMDGEEFSEKGAQAIINGLKNLASLPDGKLTEEIGKFRLEVLKNKTLVDTENRYIQKRRDEAKAKVQQEKKTPSKNKLNTNPKMNRSDNNETNANPVVQMAGDVYEALNQLGADGLAAATAAIKGALGMLQNIQDSSPENNKNPANTKISQVGKRIDGPDGPH